MKHEPIVHIVDSDRSIAEGLFVLLDTYGITVRTYTDAESFLSAGCIELTEPGCLLIESNLSGSSGLSLLRTLNERGFKLPVILLTDIASTEVRAQARRFGATDVLEKPLMNAFLLERLAQLLPGAIDITTQAPCAIELPDGTQVIFRVIRPEDANIEQAFVQGLSARSRYLRFFSAIKELSANMLERFAHPDYPQSCALIATVAESDGERQIGVARYCPMELEGAVDFAVAVADEWQGRGLATHLLSGLTVAAAVAGVNRMEGLVLSENGAMLRLAEKLGFSLSRCPDDASLTRVVKILNVRQHSSEIGDRTIDFDQ